MAAAYWLELETEMATAAIAESLWGLAIARGLLSDRVPDSSGFMHGIELESGLWIRVLAVDPDPDDPVIELGVRPTVLVSFRSPSDDPGVCEDQLIGLVAPLVERLDGGAILTWKYGTTVWLLKRAGRITLSDDPELWPPDRLALFTGPVGRADQHLP